MNCIGTECEYTKEPSVEFYWLVTKTTSTINCQFETIQIKAPTLKDPLLMGNTGPCYAKFKQCEIGKSMIIWDSKIIHQCPYEKIKTDNFLVQGDLIFSAKENQHSHLLFKKLKNIRSCGQNFSTTTNGLFISESKNQSLFEITTVDIEERSKLQIADGDRSFMELSENINKQNINNLKQQCILHHFMIKHLTADDFEIFEPPVYSQKSLYLFKLNNSLLSPLQRNSQR